MFRFERLRYAALPAERRSLIAAEATALLASLGEEENGDVALAQILGDKADLMLTHYARSFEGLAAAQLRFDGLSLREYLRPQASYVSILELGLYEASAHIHANLAERALEPHGRAWIEAFDAALRAESREPRNAARLWAKIPARRYVCFYPMDKKRGEALNWYRLPYEERARLMQEHGKIGRTYHGLVTQVISGSIGFDDYEWGVDLYADDPLVFKKLIYEMRFDEASARYAAFGPFYTGLQFTISQLETFLEGTSVPELIARPASREPVLSQ
jgi:chlorite dismutase